MRYYQKVTSDSDLEFPLGSATVFGTIKWAGRPYGANVSMQRDGDLFLTWQRNAEADGTYRFTDFPPGKYLLSVNIPNNDQKQFTLAGTETMELNFNSVAVED